VAIITGGASGIGRALATALAQHGAEIILADIQVEAAEQTALEIRRLGGNVEVREVDVGDYPAVQNLVHQTLAGHGRIDFLFNNAGIMVLGHARFYELETWRQVLRVNLDGVIHGVQAAYSIMRRQGFGHIVNTASAAGLVPFSLAAAYTASKHAVVGLSLALRAEAASWGVRVSALCPGLIRTPMLTGQQPGNRLHPFPPNPRLKNRVSRRAMDPDRFAAKVLAGLRKNRPLIVTPWRVNLLRWVNCGWLPLLLRRQAAVAARIDAYLTAQGIEPDQQVPAKE
jgi:NAD(P)-dependent dehydrogenase (short-subunit alcohol dehydrogenase family)